MAEGDYTPQAVGPRTARAVRLRGLRPVVGDYARFATGLAAGLPWSVPGAHGHFDLGGETYPYLYHRHKFTWLTERAVEVPVARAVVERHAGRRILEVGNVLSHYGSHDHVITDKYEEAPGVLNLDAMDLGGLGEFDLVVAISTLEHVGRDEEDQDPDKAAAAFRALAALLAPGGELLVTVPVGYHHGLDDALRTGALPVTRQVALRRTDLGPHWREVPVAEVWGTPYDFLLYSARAVVFASFERPA